MYQQYYGLAELPFTITPNPRFVYLSPRHRAALAHSLYGGGQGGSGGFVQLTGEVGTGKTTLCRVALEQAPENTHIRCSSTPCCRRHSFCRPSVMSWALPSRTSTPAFKAFRKNSTPISLSGMRKATGLFLSWMKRRT